MHLSPGKTVCVKNVSVTTQDEIVYELCLQTGRVANACTFLDEESKHTKYYLIEYEDEEQAKYSANVLDKIELYEKPIRVFLYSKKQRQNNTVVLYVKNIDKEITERDLKNVFDKFGQVVGIHIPRDAAGNGSKEYGFVHYQTYTEGDRAVKNLDGKLIGKKVLSVQYAKRTDGSSGLYGSKKDRDLSDNLF